MSHTWSSASLGTWTTFAPCMAFSCLISSPALDGTVHGILRKVGPGEVRFSCEFLSWDLAANQGHQ